MLLVVLVEGLQVIFFSTKSWGKFTVYIFIIIDGGANLHMTWTGTPGSHEQLSIMSTSSSGNPSLSSGTGTQLLEHNQHVFEELAVAR